jgi:outer membrane protein OmpA-like peptidoglycan-associated protein
MNRALIRLTRARATLAALLPELSGEPQTRAKAALGALDQTLSDIPNADAKARELATKRAQDATRSLKPLLAAPLVETNSAKLVNSPASAMLATAEEAETTINALAQSVALKKLLPAPAAREKLEAWTRANAIFFSDDADYRDASSADRKIAELAGLMSGNALTLRIIGYTDGLGGAGRNSPLSLARANKVADELAAAGINRDRLIVVGRPNPLDISADDGTGSPNRRVEFEVGFEGEAR